MGNTNPRFIHETVLRDIVDLASGISSETEPLRGIFSNTSYRSVARGAANLTLVFPVIAEESVSVDAARMNCKAIERKAVTMMQMLFSAINITNTRNAIDYIRTLHTNIDLDDNMDVGEFIDAMDRVSNESAQDTGIVIDKTVLEAVKQDMATLGYTLPMMVKNESLQRFDINGDDHSIIQEARTDEDDAWLAGADFAAKQTIATDVRKANELVPTLITVKFHVVDDGGCPIAQTAIVGIKAKLQYVSRQDMMNRLILKNKDRNGLFNFLRATTREISFWKDFVFAIDRAKMDALSTNGRGSSDRVWKLLERRAIKSRMKRFTGMVNDASSITTLIISKDTADLLEKQERIHVFHASHILPIMEAYNIMCFCVVDEVLEKVHFLFDDGSGKYEVLSFTHLEREENNNYKKIINLLAASR